MKRWLKFYFFVLLIGIVILGYGGKCGWDHLLAPVEDPTASGSSSPDQTPVLTSPGNKSVNENTLLTFTLLASDLNGDAIDYSMVNTPTGATLIASSGGLCPGHRITPNQAVMW